MAIIKCKMCGGDIVLNEEKTFGTCEYCGSVMTLPKVSDDQRAARFNRGNHFRRQGDFDKALAVYESIVREDDTDAEAHWCCALCRFGIEYVEDPNTYEFIPTCHRASFDSFTEDVDYLAALEHSDGITKRQYQKDAGKIADVQRGILATSQNEEPYDVFICCKETDDQTKERTRDSLDAQEIYYQLTQEGYRVFFSRITLEDKVGAEYEPYIFAALNSSKVMVAIGSKPEYFNAVWVKNEWSRFLAMMRKDRSKLLLPCYKGMDPYDLPEQLGVLQGYDMAKIGFMQDLIRGIKKVLQKDEPKQTEVKNVSQGGVSSTSLVKRAFIFLEDGKWDDANKYIDKALDIDPENGSAYLGLALIKSKCHDKYAFADVFVSSETLPDISGELRRAKRFGDAELNQWLTAIERKRTAEKEKKQAELEAKRAAEKAALEAKRAAEQAKLEAKRAAEKAALEAKKAAEIKAKYETACTLQETGEENSLLKASEIFKSLLDYRDSADRAITCTREFEEQKAARKLREEYERAAARARLAPIRALSASYKGIISSSLSDVIGLKEDGTVVADCCYKSSSAYYKISEWKDIVAISIEFNYTVGLKRDGTATADGNYIFQKQGFVFEWKDLVAIATGHNHTIGLKKDGTLVATGDNQYGQCNVSGWRDIVAIATGFSHTLGLKKDGTVIAAGENKPWVCDVTEWMDIVDIAAAPGFSCGLKADGTVVAVGESNKDGQCNVSGWKNIIAIAAGGSTTFGLKEDGTVIATGRNTFGQCNVSDWKDIVAITTDGYNVVGLKKNGTVVLKGAASDDLKGIADWKLFRSTEEREKDYVTACSLQASETTDNLKSALKIFEYLWSYKECRVRAKNCRTIILNREKSALQNEHSQLKGIFSGRRRKEIEARLAEINNEMKSL